MNSIVKMNLKKISDKYLWGQHPEAALRYSPVVKEIRNRGLSSSKIIEIGSGSLGITPYFKKRIVGLDIDFSGPKSKYLHKIKYYSSAVRAVFGSAGHFAKKKVEQDF